MFTVLGVILPYFQKLLSIHGFNEKEIGYILAAFNTAGIIASPFLGWISDRSRFRHFWVRLLILGTMVTFLFFSWITGYWANFFLAVTMGIFLWPLPPLLDGLSLRYMEQHGSDYGRPRSMGSIAFVCSVVLLEFLGVSRGGTYGLNLIVGGGVACCLFYAFVCFFFPLGGKKKSTGIFPQPEPHHFDWDVLRSKEFISFLFVVFFTRFSMAGYYSFFTLFLQKEIGFQHAGFFWILATLCEVPVIFFASFLVRRIGLRNLFTLGVIATSIRLMGLALAPNVYWIIPLQFLHAFTFGAFFVAAIHYLDLIIPHGMKQSATTLFSSVAFGLSAILGSGLAGELVYHYGFRFMYGCYSIIAAFSLVIHFMFLKVPDKRRVLV